MTSHHIFLPPPTLQPFPLSIVNQKSDDTLKLKFHNLITFSADIAPGQSQSLSLRNRLGRRTSTWIEFSQGGLDSLEKSTVLGKRFERAENGTTESYIGQSGGISNVATKEDALLDEGISADLSRDEVGTILPVEQVGNQVIIKDFEDDDRRRSKRVTRQSVSLLNTLPQVYPSAPDSVSGILHPSQGESHDSLSTTTSSFPSQLLTNPGNTSVSNLPNWSIPLHKLTTLSTIISPSITSRTSRMGGNHTVIVCVLSTEPLVQRQRKEEKAQNREGSLFIGKWTITSQPLLGESEITCTVRLWDDCAKIWGEKVRRGDVVLLENVELKPSTSKEPAHLSLSTHHRPKITILYRTLPRYETTRNDYIYRPPSRLGIPAHLGENTGERKGRILLEDKVLRPDLRLGRSEVGVRKVESIAKWFANWVGGEGPA